MVIIFDKTLDMGLGEIGFDDAGIFIEHIVYALEEKLISRTKTNNYQPVYSEVLKKISDVEIDIIGSINNQYGHSFIHNVIGSRIKPDAFEAQLDMFYLQAGSNSFRGEYKAPYRLCAWLGNKSFILSYEQKGKGFNAKEIDKKRIKFNAGGGFNLYRNSSNDFFFNDPLNATAVYLQFK